MTDYGFVIDLERCVGCHGCAVACKEANGTPPGDTRCKVLRSYEGTYPDTKRIIRPVMCMMCEEPACVDACPTGASAMNDDGIVLIDKEVCIGCQKCMEACPYGARYYIADSNGYFGEDLNEYEAVTYKAKMMLENTVDKCDFCIGHSADGEPDPVCVRACMTEARYFGPLEDAKALIKERGGDVWDADGSGASTSPRVFYLPVVEP